jgi:hypothetical protein
MRAVLTLLVGALFTSVAFVTVSYAADADKNPPGGGFDTAQPLELNQYSFELSTDVPGMHDLPGLPQPKDAPPIKTIEDVTLPFIGLKFRQSFETK